MRSKLIPLLLAATGFAACGLLVRVHNAHIEQVRPRFTADEMEAAQESIALSLMGQVQFTAHSLIWMKTLEYLHYGVALRPPTPAEEARGFHAHEATDVGAGLAHQCGVPIVLSEEMDWRGPVGQLHRLIVPHMEIHRHDNPVELIPWYQLTLKINPNIERLYTLGAFFMADFAGKPHDALHLLETGVQANPWTFEVRAALGRLLFDNHEDLDIPPPQAYQRAAEVLRQAVERGLEEKARAERGGAELDAYQQQLLHESYLFLARSLTELGRFEEALAVCQEGYEVTAHPLLRVQQRVINRRMSGDAPAEEPGA